MTTTVACVFIGSKYDVSYVSKLQSMVKRAAPSAKFLCLTDQVARVAAAGVPAADIRNEELPGWWSKMKLFDAEYRSRICAGRWVYFDLDTVILRSIRPLLDWDGEFGICANFTRLAGNTDWPCKYGSCVMSFAEGFGATVWERFSRERAAYIKQCVRGDQEAVERLFPHASLLQGALPPKFFVGYRDLTEERPDAAVVVFAGKHKPDNSPYPWVREAWS